MFDALIREASDRLGLGANARSFIGVLLGMIFNPATGGFSGFAQKFRDAGLGSLFDSWVGSGTAAPPLAADQAQQLLGGSYLSGLGSRFGLPAGVVNTAAAVLLPKLVGALTPGGRIPTAAPPEARALIDSATPTTARPAPVETRSSAGWLKWLIPLIIILGLGWCVLHRPKTSEQPPAQTSSPPVTAPAAQTQPRFTLESRDGKANISGQLGNENDRKRLMDAITAAFGAGNVNGDITVDANTLPANWIDKLIAALPDLKANGVKVAFDGNSLKLDTSSLTEAERFALSDKLRGAFGGYGITGLWDRASAALAGLKPGASGADLVKALNLMQINFDTGSATITADSMEILEKASNAIKAAPAGTRIEVGGHTDNTGDAASNVTLSQQRADAVMAALVKLGVTAGNLTAKGYGQDKPIGDNNTDAGRAQNRRIEFTVQG